MADQRRKAICTLLLLELDNELEEIDNDNTRDRTTWVKSWGARREEKGCFHQVKLQKYNYFFTRYGRSNPKKAVFTLEG